jgi:hypothetical protein
LPDQLIYAQSGQRAQGASGLSQRVRLKGSDYSFTQPLRIALPAFRDLDYIFGDKKGRRRRAVSHLQTLKGHFVGGNQYRDVFGSKRPRSF